jgi:hypothetical protein
VKKNENIAFYNLLDTKNTRDIRTIINLETIPMLDQFAAQGHDATRKEWVEEKLSEPKWNYSHRIWVKQFPPDGSSLECIMNIIDGSIEYNNKKYFFIQDPIEVEEKNRLLDNFLIQFMLEHNFGSDFFLDDVNKKLSVTRRNLYIANRHDKVQPKTDCNTNLYDQSEINWNIILSRITFLDIITIITFSRAARFKIVFRHDWKNCKGALVKESNENKLHDFFEIRD